MLRGALALPASALVVATCVLANLPRAQAAPSMPSDGSLSLEEYLLALERIAPAARAGAEAYRDAYERRCRRRLGVDELRRLVVEGSGDPVLMAMIGAAHRRDQVDLERLGASISCQPRR